MRVKLYQALESLFSSLESWAGSMRERFAICSHCGQNRYTGKPCVKFNSEVR
jgi:hypothetical protein